MALNTITPSNREEEYLSAIAGDEGASAPVPSNRREEWLRRIAEGQGDQTDRLDHIEDQIPVDPTSDDVGKVMTVVEDTSGETPVYKWSAVEAAGGGPLFVSVGFGNLSESVTFSAVDYTAFPGGAAFKAAAREVRNLGDIGKFRKWLAEHIDIDVNGCRAICSAGSINSGTSSVTLRAYIPSVLPVSGTDTFLYVAYEFGFDMREEETTVITFTGNAKFYKNSDSNTEITASTVTSKDYPKAFVTCKLY